MRKVSAKEAINKRKKAEAYRKFDEDNDGTCSGCEIVRPGSHSHLVPVSEAKELESEVNNIVWHCMTCHDEWESHDVSRMSKLKDFERNMEYIRKVRPLYYNRLMLKS